MAHPWKITSNLLLSIYLLIPAVLGIVFVDQVFAHGAFKNYLQVNFQDLAFITLILNLPHIVASHVTLFDRDYVSHYKPLLLKSFGIAAVLGVALPLLFGMKIFYIFMGTYTMYHVFAQQFGLTWMLLSTRPTIDFKAWLWLTTAACSLGYLMIYQGYYFDEKQILYAKMGMLVCFVISIVFIVRVMRFATPEKTKTARLYLYSNIMMGFVCFALFASGYAFFTILIPRFVHDLTAFAIYIVHDHNRNEEKTRNYFYEALAYLKIKPWVACVPLAMGLAYLLTIGSEHNALIRHFTFTIIFLHFIMEGRIWKAGTPHRESLPIIKN